METDKAPTFAEALLAQALWWARCTQLSKMSYSDAESIARRAVESAPPSIRRALGVDKQPVVEPRELSLEKQLAAAVARAEKSEEQMRHDSDARRLAEAGRVSAVEAMCASERESDDLKAELDKAKVSCSGLEAYSRQMAKDRDKWNAQCAAAVARAEKAEAQAAEARDAFTLAVGERDALRAELDKAKAELADVEKAVSGYPMIGPVSSQVFQNGRVWAPGPWTPGQQPMLEAIVESREFQTSRAVQMESERDALAAKLAEKEAARVRIYNELIAYQHERDRLAGIADRASKILDEAAARKALDAKDTQ